LKSPAVVWTEMAHKILTHDPKLVQVFKMFAVHIYGLMQREYSGVRLVNPATDA